MFAKAQEILIITAMKNHVYRFGNKIRVQKEGGPIGLSLTGDVADCVMICWDKLFLAEVNRIGMCIEIYKRFKDDITIVAESVEKGTMFKDGNLIVDPEKKFEDLNKTDDNITMEVLQSVANSINDMIKVTIDTPSNHDNMKLPILDTQIRMNESEKNRLDFEFFEKPTKNKNVILFDSALSAKQKREILTQECLRRLRNTKIELGKNVQNHYLTEFMLKLKKSGYPEKYRLEILDSAQKAFKKMVSDDKNGKKPLYRNRNWNSEERKEDKRNKKTNWFNKNSKGLVYKSVLFYQLQRVEPLQKN